MFRNGDSGSQLFDPVAMSLKGGRGGCRCYFYSLKAPTLLPVSLFPAQRFPRPDPRPSQSASAPMQKKCLSASRVVRCGQHASQTMLILYTISSKAVVDDRFDAPKHQLS